MDLRVFISVPIPVKNELDDLLSELRETGRIRTPPKSQMHLTLCFVGDVPEDRLNDICRCVDDAVSANVPSMISVKGIGTFPENGRPRVVWAGIETDLPLSSISDDIRERLDTEGISYDGKAFKAHLTIGRVTGDVNISDMIDRYSDTTFITASCSEIRVMKSELLPSGAKHSILHSSKFRVR